jgi:energy-coupling factor transport system permease protein
MSAPVEYIPGNSIFHRLNPLTKILWTFSVIIVCFVTENPAAILCVFVTNLIIAAISNIIRQMAPSIKGLLIFCAVVSVCQVFFIKEGTIMFYAFPWLRLGPITDRGLRHCVLVSLRMLSTVSTIPMLMMTTPMTDIITVMTQKLRLSYKYSFMLITALKFIPAFIYEMDQVMQAQMSRGYNSDTKNPFRKLSIIIPLAIPLLITSINKSRLLAISMEVRGFGSGQRSCYRDCSMGNADYIVIIIMGFVVLGSVAFNTILHNLTT